jgi:hypothetical protein
MLVAADAGNYRPNAWGLHDMHGNVWEWTRSQYAPYPYRPKLDRLASPNTRRVTVRGGSWYDRPKRCRSAFRLSYPAWQKVYNVGFRVVIEADDTKVAYEDRTDAHQETAMNNTANANNTLASPQPLKGPVYERNAGPVIAKEPERLRQSRPPGTDTRGMFLRRR